MAPRSPAGASRCAPYLKASLCRKVRSAIPPVGDSVTGRVPSEIHPLRVGAKDAFAGTEIRVSDAVLTRRLSVACPPSGGAS
jgi:hypothetical protein